MWLKFSYGQYTKYIAKNTIIGIYLDSDNIYLSCSCTDASIVIPKNATCELVRERQVFMECFDLFKSAGQQIIKVSEN